MSTEGAGERTAAPGRIALRSPLEAFLWVFITRLIALLTATRVPAASIDQTTDDDASPPALGTVASDPSRARRVAASRRQVRPISEVAAPTRSSRTASADSSARAVAVTATAAAVAGAAAFAAGRRRGRR